jgi:hypothetical protein
MADQFKYDVALSFMMRDIGVARHLYNALSETLNVFLFERNQDELTGREGVEVFRTPFLEARVSVVLYRQGYGEAGWTGVERTAILEACLKRGFRNLFVVAMEPKPKMPAWVPATHIYHNLDLFPVEQLIGAIKSKVLELEGVFAPMTAEKRAQLHDEKLRYEAAKKQFQTEGFPIVHREIEAVFSEVGDKTAALNDASNNIRSAYNPGRCVITNDTVSLVVLWHQEYHGSLDGAELRVDEYKARVALPNERPLMYIEQPQWRRTKTYTLELTPARQHLWHDKSDKSYLPSTAVADRLVIQFFDLAERVAHKRRHR